MAANTFYTPYHNQWNNTISNQVGNDQRKIGIFFFLHIYIIILIVFYMHLIDVCSDEFTNQFNTLAN